MKAQMGKSFLCYEEELHCSLPRGRVAQVYNNQFNNI